MIEFQRLILGDRVRNEAFAKALARTIVRGRTTVADLGAGTGFLSFLASRLGAKRCFLYEVSELLDLSRELAKRNILRRRLRELPGATVDVAEIEPSFFNLAKQYFGAADNPRLHNYVQDGRRFLKPGGVMIPQKLRQFVAPVASPRLAAAIDVWGGIGHGLDFTQARAVSLQNVFVRTVRRDDLLATPDAAQVWDAVDSGATRRASAPRRSSGSSPSRRRSTASRSGGSATWSMGSPSRPPPTRRRPTGSRSSCRRSSRSGSSRATGCASRSRSTRGRR